MGSIFGALAPWACDPCQSRGRRVFEPLPVPSGELPNEHQRDRDRIVHSSAFRRLVYKTQVFVNHEGDLFRTRLTHSLEVAGLARSAARALRLNEDLVESIALAHDLGHAPFGHAGQDALQACMRRHGGFEHNLQSLRVVDRLEQGHAAFDGLNLSFETREGILKHCSREHARGLLAADPAGPAARFIAGGQPSLEAQIVNLADEIAYNAHDIDDGVRSGLLSLAELGELASFRAARDAVLAGHPSLAGQPGRRLLAEILDRMRNGGVRDLVSTTSKALAEHAPANADAVRELPPLARFSEGQQKLHDELKRFLLLRLYRHPQVAGNSELARTAVAELFAAYDGQPTEMPAAFAQSGHRQRGVADYIAGMTDRFALREHRRLTGRRLFEA